MSEEPSAHDRVVRIVKLEEERLAGAQRLESAVPARLPEIDLIQVRPRRRNWYQSLSVTATKARTPVS